MTGPGLRQRLSIAAVVVMAPLAVSLFRGRAAAGPDGPVAPSAPPRPEDEASDVVLMLSGREDGLLKPCGCTEPQMGGLERRAVLWARARVGAAASAAISIGETLAVGKGDRRQDGFKAELFRASLEAMDYAGQLLGPSDLEGMVDALLTPYGGASTRPRPPLNVLVKRGGPIAAVAPVDPVLRFTLPLAAGELRVRAISVVDPTVRGRLLNYGAVEAVNPPATAVAALSKEPGLLIVAAHVMREDLAAVVAEATARADLAIVVDVLGEVASRRPVRDRRFDRALLVTFEGHGKEVLLVRLRRDGTGFTASADAVVLGPDPYEAPADVRYRGDLRPLRRLPPTREGRADPRGNRLLRGSRGAADVGRFGRLREVSSGHLRGLEAPRRMRTR